MFTQSIIPIPKLNLEVAPIDSIVDVLTYDEALIYSYFYDYTGNWRLPRNDEYNNLMFFSFFRGWWQESDHMLKPQTRHPVQLVRDLMIEISIKV